MRTFSIAFHASRIPSNRVTALLICKLSVIVLQELGELGLLYYNSLFVLIPMLVVACVMGEHELVIFANCTTLYSELCLILAFALYYC